MGQQINKSGLIKKIISSSQPTDAERIAYERYAQEFDKKRKLNSPVFNAGENLMESAINFGKGLIGIDDAESGQAISGSNALGQVLTAGLPFHKIMGGKPVFHGTKKIFNRFDITKNDPYNWFGQQFNHFAENPDYAANKYANSAWNEGNPNVIPIKIHNENTLDLTEKLNDDDLSILFDTNIFSKKHSDVIKLYQDPENNTSVIQEALIENPELIHKIPWDSIRYPIAEHNMETAWAVPPKVKISTPWGIDMTPQDTGNIIRNIYGKKNYK